MYSSCCCSCSYEAKIIKIGQSSHKMYSNNTLNFQESMTILNTCTKKSGNLLNDPYTLFNPICISEAMLPKHTHIHLSILSLSLYIYIQYSLSLSLSIYIYIYNSVFCVDTKSVLQGDSRFFTYTIIRPF